MTTKRPNQTLFYPTDEAQEVLADLDKGDKSEFINQAIVAYAERKKGGAMYPLQQAYETLQYIRTPESDAVREALREILWYRSDTPESVRGRIRFDDGTVEVKDFSDFDKAALYALGKPTAHTIELYGKDQQPQAIGSRTKNDTMSWSFVS